MSTAATQPLSDIAEVNPRVDLRGLGEDSPVSFIPMADVTDTGQWVGRQARPLREVCVGYTPFAEGDVLFAKITPCMENGKGAHATGLTNGVGFGSTEFHVLRARGDNDARFLFHWLQAPPTRTRAVAFMGGSAGQQRVQPEFFSRFHIPRIDPAEQRRIAAVLDTVDEAIAATEAVIAKLRQVRAGLLHDLLTRGLDENGDLRDPVAHPEQFKDSVLGRIPKEWEVPTLERICRYIGSGVTPRGGQEVYASEGVTFIRSQNVTVEGLMLTDVAYIPEQVHLEMVRSAVFAHDVLFNITGASIGRCCTVPVGLGSANVNQHVCILRVPNATDADAAFLAAVLASPIGQQQLAALNTFGNRQGLNYQQLGSFLVPWPGRGERELISECLGVADEELRAETTELAKLQHLKSGLSHDLLSGRVRVPETVVMGAE